MKKANLSLFDHTLMYSPMDSKRKPYRTTQIIATIPTEEPTKEAIIEMIEAGMNIARFNAAGGKEDLKSIEIALGLFREAVTEYNDKRYKECEKQAAVLGDSSEDCKEPPIVCPAVHIATALDLKGSYFETGICEGCDAFDLCAGNEINLTNDPAEETLVTDKSIYVNYPKIYSLQPDQVVIVDSTIKLKVITVHDSDCPKGVLCLIERGGSLNCKTRLEVNIPGLKCPGLSSMSEDTLPAINFCKQHGIDILIAPISDPAAFQMIKCTVSAEGNSPIIKVVANIEGLQAVQKIDKIIEKADGVMIPRGRLGRNSSPEQVIVFQKNIIAKCLKAGIPSIVFSDVLGSMESQANDGTSAEVADVFNIVMDGADGVMLDTRVSTKACIEVLRNSIMEAEDMINYRRSYMDLLTQLAVPPTSQIDQGFTDVMALSACTAAMVNAANAIIVLTESGKTVQMVAKYRPECPIISVSSCDVVARQVLLHRGVFSIVAEGE